MNHTFEKEDKYVSYRVEDGIAYIGFNRPEKLNAISDEVAIELYHTFQHFDIDPDAHVAILYGEGSSFSSGADVFQRQMRPDEEKERFGVQSQTSRWLDLFNHSLNWKPIIAAVHGYCVGMATAMAFRCELVVATESSKFQVTETPRGLNGSSVWAILQHRGAGIFAEEVAFTGRMFTGREAGEHNIVNRVVPDGEHLTAATELAKQIMGNPPLALRLITRVRRQLQLEKDITVKVFGETRPALFKTEDFQEATRAFAEKRSPGPWKAR